MTAFHPGAVWPDNNGVHINAHGGGVLWQEGVFYWFGEHKIEGRAGNLAHVGVHCYSSRDLYNWKDEGIVLKVSDAPESDIAKECILERPKVIYNAKTRKFVMWFHLELKGQGYLTGRSGVAVSDNAAGPYEFVNSFRPHAGVWPENLTAGQKRMVETRLESQPLSGQERAAFEHLEYFSRDFREGQMAADMTLFVDDDGRAYHLYASEKDSTFHISLLSGDYLTPAGRYVRVFSNRHMEAPSLFKRRGKYYFIGSGCTGWKPNAARSAAAGSIWGPWTELGNPCVGVDSEITFGGQSTFVLPLPGREDAYIAMFDIWRPDNAVDGRYMWLPVIFENDRIAAKWMPEWDLTFFDRSLHLK